jgi:HSP20 family protein
MNIGPDGRPQIRQFGNIKPSSHTGFLQQPTLSAEREPLVQVDATDKEVKIIAEMPGVSKDKIRINAYDRCIEIKSEDPNRKYHKTIEVPEDIDIESGRSKYNNGIIEIEFRKKEQTKKGKKINIE